MEHYSIKAIDIFIDEIASDKGWHQGDAVLYSVNNCAWQSRVELQLKANQYGFYELQGRQFFNRGDQKKMLQDQNITLMALQAHIYRRMQDKATVSWIDDRESVEE